MEGWAQLAGSLTGVGFAVWFAWYSTTSIIPKLVNDNRIDMAKLHELHAQEVRDLAVTFKGEIAAERQHCIAERNNLLAFAVPIKQDLDAIKGALTQREA